MIHKNIRHNMKRVIIFAIAATFVTIMRAQTFVVTRVDITENGYRMFEKEGTSRGNAYKGSTEALGQKCRIEIYDEVLKLIVPDDNKKGYDEIPHKKKKDNIYTLVGKGDSKMDVILNTFFGYIRSFEWRWYDIDGMQILTIYCKRD